MNDAWFGAFAAPHLAGHEPDAASAAVAGAAVIGQVDAVAQGSIEQQRAAARQEAIAIDGNLVSSCHCLTRKASKLPIHRLVRVTRRAELPGMLSKPSVSDLKPPPHRSAVEP
jgi:hypothetical protein